VLKEILAPKWEKGPGYWKKNCIMMSSLICTCHFSPNVIQVVQSGRLNWVELVGSMKKIEMNTCLLGKPDVRCTLENYRRRWEDNFKSNLGK